MSGSYEDAVEHLTAVISAGSASDAQQRVAKQRLAETFMALGRLEESIETLEALRKRWLYDAGLALVLAVAYDRNEQIAKAKEAYKIGRARDPNFGTLSGPSRLYIPPEDEHYFLGLAFGYDASHPQHLFGAFHFREYLHVARDGLWARRAQKHLESIVEAKAGSNLRIYGTAGMDDDKARAAVAAKDADLQDCVAKMPRALFRLRLIRLPKQKPAKTKPKSKRRPRKLKKKHRAPRGVFDDFLVAPRQHPPRIRTHTEQTKALILRIGKPQPETRRIEAVTQCLVRVGETIELPQPTGGSGTYSKIEFGVIARGTGSP